MLSKEYLGSISGRLLALTLVIALASASLIALPGSRPHALTIIGVAPPLCVVTGLFSVGFAVVQFPRAVLPLIIGQALLAGLVPAALSALIERGAGAGIMLFALSFGVLVAAIMAGEMPHPRAHAHVHGRP